MPKRRKPLKRRPHQATLDVDKFSAINVMKQYRWIAFTGCIGIAFALLASRTAKTDGMSVHDDRGKGIHQHCVS